MPVPEALLDCAGRWAALARGAVAGVGVSRAEAEAAGGHAQPGAPLELVFVPEPFTPPLPDLAAAVQRAAPDPAQVWLVGGAVRDLLLGRVVHDLDFAVAGDGLALARRVAAALGAPAYPLDADRGVGRVIVPSPEGPPVTLDFARLRGPDIYADLAGRDFTVNALAVPLAEPDVVIDPLRGGPDLRGRLLRDCSPDAIGDDPIRAVRAVRLAAEFSLRIEPNTRARLKQARLAGISAERQRDEFIRCLAGPNPAAAVRALQLTGLLDQIAPELARLPGLAQSPPHALDAWEHTLETLTRLAEVVRVLGRVHDVDAASDLILGLVSVRLGRYRAPLSAHLAEALGGERPARWLLMLAALLHDCGKPQTGSREPDGRIRFLGHEELAAAATEDLLVRLRFSADEVRRARLIVANHMRPRQLTRAGEPSPRAIYRFYRDLGPAGVDTVLLSLGDFLAKYGGSPPPADEWDQHVAGCARLLEAYYERRSERVSPPQLVNGDDLMAALGLKPGPELGRLLELVREAQAAGEVTDADGAMDFARRQLELRNDAPA